MSEETLTELQAGTLTSLEAQRHDPKRVSVFVDGRFMLGIPIDLVYLHGLQKGLFLSVEKLQELRDADRLWRAKAVALQFISHKPRTEREVQQKLAEQAFPEAIVEQVLERFRELGYLDDAKFANHYSQTRLGQKGHGPRKIQQDLRRKGVSTEQITHALEESTAQGEHHEAALALAQKRWLRLANEADARKRRKKLQDFLLRRGFDFDTVRYVMKQLE